MKNTLTHTTELEVAQNFVIHNYGNLISGEKIPPIKFKFGEDGYQIFNYLKENPIPNPCINKVVESIDQSQIDEIRNVFDQVLEDDIIIDVPDAYSFFKQLSLIANMYYQKSYYENPQTLGNNFFSDALWVRMTPQDFYNIGSFLEKQIEFLYSTYSNNFLTNLDEVEYDKYLIKCSNEFNKDDMFETYSRMCFKVYDKEDENISYELPSIHYGVVNKDSKKTCYIYGIQNMARGIQDKKIARSLYQLNKGIENPSIHPSFILAMKTFIDILKNNNINSIRVPLLEVLNYDYHRLFSKKYKKTYPKKWFSKMESIIDVDNPEQMENYICIKRIYDNYVDKEDMISKSKTEVFASIFYRLQEQFDDIDIEVKDFELVITHKKNKVLERY